MAKMCKNVGSFAIINVICVIIPPKCTAGTREETAEVAIRTGAWLGGCRRNDTNAADLREQAAAAQMALSPPNSPTAEGAEKKFNRIDAKIAEKEGVKGFKGSIFACWLEAV